MKTARIGTVGLLLVFAGAGIMGCSDQTPVAVLITPSTYTGEIPCADCPGNLITLTLRADSLFWMRQVYRAAVDGQDKAFVEWGRWTRDSKTGHLDLTGGEFLQKYTIVDSTHIRMLDQYGQPIESNLNYTLTLLPTIDACRDTVQMRGAYSYMADAARLHECRFQVSFPVAQKGDNAIVESAYLHARTTPAESLLVAFDGHLERLPAMEGTGTEEMVVIDRWLGLWPQSDCRDHHLPVKLEYTYWRVFSVGTEKTGAYPMNREPFLRFLPGENSFLGFTGCNRIRGGWRHGDDQMSFSEIVQTKAACQPGMDLETRLLKALDAVDSYVITSDTLVLRSGPSEQVRLTAVH